MNSKWKQRWLEALRSGDYAQGKFMLKRPEDRYCCLGVLCDIYSKENKGEWSKSHFVYGGEVSRNYLPKNLSKYLGITKAQESRLSSLNDEGVSFRTIADIIEEEF